MKLYLFLILFFSTFSLHAQVKLEKIWESDSTILNGPESATFDSMTNTVYVSSMNNGMIALMDLNGKFKKKNWISGLTANKGIGFYNGQLYTAETTGIAIIDMTNEILVKRIPIDGAIMLNDLAVDSKGTVYVSDTRSGKVYKVEGDKASVFLENIPGANGLLSVGSDLYVAGTSVFLKVNEKKELKQISNQFENGLDGIVRISNEEFILSNYTGILYYVNCNGAVNILLDSRDKKIMANDISYNEKTKTLFVPSFRTNRIIAYRVK